ncbi:type III secretion system effector protein [Acidovorax sp. SUPP950]|uniref:M91 family zinc metallopeptidase n=1 Tax=Acidovorax sp. SUPP950 TaxID=511901 RepID=UPI0023CDDE7C|nr:M91 family zinc metallopeptidase [Acidovorax sp. SUPP950]GKS76331.1 type III secretion system effector protein [Acidovorax sp. SUPP950]
MPIHRTDFPGVYIHTPRPQEAGARTLQQVEALEAKNQDFLRRNQEILEQLASQSSGRTLLRQIESITTMAPRKRVVLTPSQGGWPQALSCQQIAGNTQLRPMDNWDDIDSYMSRRPSGDSFMPEVAAAPMPGRETPGADEVWIRTDPDIGMKFSSEDSDEYELSADHYVATLGHEMIHARDSLHGIQPHRSEDTSTSGHQGSDRPLEKALLPVELRTIGVGPYADEVPSENSIRREHGLTLRRSYHGFTDDH